VTSAGSLEAGTCSESDYTVPGADLDQAAGPCGTITFKTYTNPSALVQVQSGSGCENYRRIADGTCAEACIGGFVGICPRALVTSAGSLEAGTCSESDYTVPGADLDQAAGPCGTITFNTFTLA